MKRTIQKTLLIVSIATAIISNTVPQVAYAHNDYLPNQVSEKINQTINGYNQKLENAYYNASGINNTYGSRVATPKIKVDFPISSKVEDLNENGLTVQDLSVNSRIERIIPLSVGYRVFTTVTTSKMMQPNSGTQIYIGGKLQDSFESSWDEIHEITMSPSKDSASGYAVTADEIVDDTALSENSANVDNRVTDDMNPASLDPNAATLDSDSTGPWLGYRVSTRNKYGFDYAKATAYADLWTSPQHQHEMNPRYPSFSENCTNFVSQVIHEGGWPTRSNLWTYSVQIPKLSTRTWMNAASNYTYLKHYTPLYEDLKNVWKAWEGSILYVDLHGKGQIDHAMYVVGVAVINGKANPIIDQKQVNRHQITLSQSLENAHRAGNNNMTWYGLRLIAFD